MTDLCFVTVAVTSKNYGDAYIQQQARLCQSIKDVYGKYADIIKWTDEYPPTSRDWLTSLYGFKPHAIQYALNFGHKKIVYCDTAMIMIKRFDPAGRAVIAVKDESCLANVVSDSACEYFGVTRESLRDKTLVGGSFYYFDFNQQIAQEVLDKWKLAELAGIFGSQDEEAAGKLQGHRHDEAVLALCMNCYGIKPCDPDSVGYNGVNMRKKHIK